MAVTTTNLGVITAYGDAVAAGYTGTKAEWQTLMASYATVGQQAVDAKNDAVAAKDTAVSKATEATTAANTATTKASEASASAQSIAQSADQIQENTDDIESLMSELTAKADQTDMLKAFPTDVATGAVASFADGANVPVKSLIVNIDPMQSGSGDPSPTNVRTISGWSEVNVRRTGKNLAELTDPPLTTTVSQVVATLGQKGTFAYTVSFDLINATYQSASGALFGLRDNAGVDYRTPAQIRRVSDNAYLGALTQPLNGRFYCTFVSRINPVRVVTYFMRESYGSWTGEMKNVQVELGTTPTDFEPYSGQSINIALGQTVYGGKLDVTKGELVIGRAMVDMGTLAWNNPNANTNVFFCKDSDWTNAVASRGIMCPIYTTHTGSTSSSAINSVADKSIMVNKHTADYPDGTTGNYAIGSLLVKDSAYSDAATFKTAMSGVMLCYPLATPLTIQLTPHEVTALLGSNNIWADSGDSAVEYRADPTLYIGRLTEPDADMVADSNITSGNYFMVGNTLYKATANIASGGAITPNVNCTRKSLSEALNELNV